MLDIIPDDSNPDELAVPVPEPIPVATNVVPTLLLAAPIRVKSVVPAKVIVYVAPIAKFPALVTVVNITGSPTSKPVELVTVILSVADEVAVAVCITVVGVNIKLNVCGANGELLYGASNVCTNLSNV